MTRGRARELSIAAGFLLALTLAVLGPVLFGDGDRVLSNEDADLAMQFVHWRAFGFGELRAGHLPLWNPHIFGGAPFLGGFQSALLYPPNWLYLVLPLGRAVNIGIALHVFLAGFFMYLWVRGRGQSPLAGAFAAVLFMFCGPHFAHIYAGHLPNLCAIVWGPLIFLAIDRWLARRTAGAILLGGAATALQILAGHPQYVFYTGIAAGLYAATGLVRAERRGTAMAGLALMPIIALGLSAAQWLEGMHAAGESLRSRGVTFAFASLFSFPPENLVTLLAPGFLGSMTAHTYWGRCDYWEMSLFFGVSGLVLAAYGLLRGPRVECWRLAGVAGVLGVLALGAHTPLFGWLYAHAPGFNKFRGLSKFTYPAVLLLIVLAATGFDAWGKAGCQVRGFPAALAGLGGVLTGCACPLLLHAPPAVRLVAQWTHALSTDREMFVSPGRWQDPAFQLTAAGNAGGSLLVAGVTLLLLGGIMFAARRRPWTASAPWARAGILAIACAEMTFFASGTLETFSLAGAQTSPAADYLEDHPLAPGERILNLENPNLAMSIGARDLWGYDPGVLRRYAEWMAVSQGVDPDRLDEDLAFTLQPALYGSLLGCRYILFPESLMRTNGGQLPVFPYPPGKIAPRVTLISQAHILPDRTALFAALRAPAFDPQQTVLLETAPQPPPAPGDGPAGFAHLVAETSDTLTIEAELTRPAVLLVADTFCSGWTARETNQAAPDKILPADYCLRAIALPAGHHRLELAYRPLAFVAGSWLSSVSLVLYGIALRLVWRRRSPGQAAA